MRDSAMTVGEEECFAMADRAQARCRHAQSPPCIIPCTEYLHMYAQYEWGDFLDQRDLRIKSWQGLFTLVVQEDFLAFHRTHTLYLPNNSSYIHY